MGTFTTKKLKLRSRAEKRRRSLKPSPKTFGVEESIAEQNLEAIRSLEAKIKEIQAQNQG